MGFFKKQFLDIIQWLDDSNNTLVYRFPMEDQEIQNGAQLTVRQGQVAIFVDQGQIADVFGPGMYKLETANLPILSNLKSWSYGFKSPFKSDVYFLNMKEFLDNKWGTANPVWIPDSQFGQVQVRAHGNYAFKIENPVVFLNNIVGTQSKYRLEEITSQLRGVIVSQFSDMIGSLHLTVAQIASNYNEIGDALKETLSKPFGDLGLSVTQFTIGNIGLPEEIEKHLKELTGMNILGSVQSDKMSKIQILKQLEIMEKSAGNSGINSMMQSGMGLSMGMQMANTFAQGLGQMNNHPINSNKEQLVACQSCHTMIKKGSKFCPECGTKVEALTKKSKFCPQCGTPAEEGMKFCIECGTKLV
ncbi:MAG: SPFH domain-containing protein [Candidatus Cellulosilyticum pullistercoris]|uniref:SPFH domain-containing protein n=1 Tax=Candidatus Cellulosilyticum pullistercoris TaxID=2838521 RepID=A0A9E2KC26_9FIRM|nr:SPFH domain-containing protein [Candidatus Cellulosilyticum pullistercoris]